VASTSNHGRRLRSFLRDQANLQNPFLLDSLVDVRNYCTEQIAHQIEANILFQLNLSVYLLSVKVKDPSINIMDGTGIEIDSTVSH
jgi:hypothetical protein